MRLAVTLSTLALLAGCATHLTSYTPTANQSVVYDQGIGAITWETDKALLTMYPTFRFQSPKDIPIFTLTVQNKTDHDIDFMPEMIRAYLDDRDCHVYTLEERLGEIRKSTRNKQIAVAVLGVAAAGAAAYGASHQTTNYSSYGMVGHRQFWTSGSIQTYDPAAGIFAGVAVGAVTVIGVQQIGKAAGHEEQVAQGIFQHSTIRPGTTVVGQVILKPSTAGYGTLKFDVPVDTARSTFTFAKSTTSG